MEPFFRSQIPESGTENRKATDLRGFQRIEKELLGNPRSSV